MASDITVSGLVVAPGVQQTYAQWEVDDPNIDGLPYLQLDRVELWAATTNDRSAASKVAEGVTFSNYVYTGLAKHYHWIKARDRSGQYGDWHPSSATAGVVAGGVWQNFSPTISSFTGTITSYTVRQAKYFKIGPNVSFILDVLINTNGTGGSSVLFTLPVDCIANSFPSHGSRGGVALTGNVTLTSGSIRLYDGTYPGADGVTLMMAGTYEADE